MWHHVDMAAALSTPAGLKPGSTKSASGGWSQLYDLITSSHKSQKERILKYGLEQNKNMTPLPVQNIGYEYFHFVLMG